jgi:phage terminase large subunit-like protein
VTTVLTAENYRRLDIAQKARYRWLLQARHNQLTPGPHHLCEQDPAICEAAIVEAKRIEDPEEQEEFLRARGHFAWIIWLILSGRGWGKTRVGAEDIARYAIGHPKSRIALVAATFSDGRDTMVEGESGLKSVIPSSLIENWNRSMGELILTNGSIMKIYSAENPERLRGPQFHRAWCLSPGTPVLTPDGPRPIETIQEGDQVSTQYGPALVTATGHRDADLWTVTLVDARTITGSAEHPVATGRGWVPLADIRSTDTIWTWCDDGDTTQVATSTATKADGPSTNTGLSTKNTTASRSPHETTSIIGTRSETTTARTTSNSLPPPVTDTSTKRPAPTSAASVGPATNRSRITGALRYVRDAVLWSLNEAAARFGAYARHAELNSRLSPIDHHDLLPIAVVDAATPVGRSGTVHNLTVEGFHQFFANGVLTHNCDELAAWQYVQDTWDMLMFGLRLGQNPQVIVTTTPKPLDFIRALVGRSRDRAAGVVRTTGSTFENAKNLARAALAELKNVYAGTRIGRQELDGEVLEDPEGALWSLALIEQTRLSPYFMPEPFDILGRTVVGVDPAVSNNPDSDSTGIVTVAMTRTKCPFCDRSSEPHAIVLDDDTGTYSPNEWALRVVSAYDRWNGDRIVAEVNQGGDLVSSNMIAERANLPIDKVHATKAKLLRAEPVFALYERGLVHHWGGSDLKELEKEMTSWDPTLKSAKSPNRLDALVWCLTALMLPEQGMAPTLVRDKRHAGRR